MKMIDDDIVCPECGGDGADAEDSTKDCWRCGGWGNVPAFTPREDDKPVNCSEETMSIGKGES